MKLPVYLDNSATTRVDPAVLQEMIPYFSELYGNAASRSHIYGLLAKDAVENARDHVAKIIGASPPEIIFTSGSTEAANLAIKGVLETYKNKGNHIITVATEHKAVLDSCKHAQKNGAEITVLDVDINGIINLNTLQAAIKKNTILIAVMYGNNETGVLQNIKKIGAIAKENNVLFFTDATQAVGKLIIQVEDDGIDLLCFSAHKIYGPKGTGALYVRRKSPRVNLISQIDGGGHERNFRSGTLNVPGIVGFGKACEISMNNFNEETSQMKCLREKLEKNLLVDGQIILNSGNAPRLPNISNILFKSIPANSLISEINKDVAVSSGSACSSASVEPSHVLTSQGLSENDAKSSLRFSIGRFNTESDIDFTIKTIKKALAKFLS